MPTTENACSSIATAAVRMPADAIGRPSSRSTKRRSFARPGGNTKFASSYTSASPSMSWPRSTSS